MQSKANIYFFGMRNDHKSQAKGLWRISILLWLISFLWHISLHGLHKYNISTFKEAISSVYIQGNVTKGIWFSYLSDQQIEDVPTVQLYIWRLTPKAQSNIPRMVNVHK